MREVKLRCSYMDISESAPPHSQKMDPRPFSLLGWITACGINGLPLHLREGKLIHLISAQTCNAISSPLNSSRGQESRHIAMPRVPSQAASESSQANTSAFTDWSSAHFICPVLASKINLCYLPLALSRPRSDQAPNCRCCNVVVGDYAADKVRGLNKVP